VVKPLNKEGWVNTIYGWTPEVLLSVGSSSAQRDMATRFQQKTKCKFQYAKHNSVVYVQLEYKGLFKTRKAPTSQRNLR
jgi:hypothetical protein